MSRQPSLNWVEIVVRPRKFTVWPSCPEVRSGFEPMQVTVNWTGNQDEWLAVKVRGFKTSEGQPIQTQPDVLEFYPSEGEVVRTVHFRVRTPGDDYCRYEIEYDRREPPETLTVEQIFLMRR